MHSSQWEGDHPSRSQGRLGLGHALLEASLQKPRWAAQGAARQDTASPRRAPHHTGLLTITPPQLGPHKSAVGKAEGDGRTGPQPQSEELSRSPHKHNAPAARPAWPCQSLLQEYMFMCVCPQTRAWVHGEQGLEALAAGRRLSWKSRLQRG